MKPNFNLKNLSHFPYLTILFAVGVLILHPLTTFLPFLSQGDHGLNLYAAQAVQHGAIPYRDFTWFYGPAMPYYYALFLELFGSGIQSILLGKTLLILAAGSLIYLNLTLIAPRLVAVAGAVWFWIFFKDFPYTFNHIGGIPVLLLIFYFTFCYIKSAKHRFLYLNLSGVILLSLIKLNFGMTALLGTILIVFLNSVFQKRNPWLFYLAAIIGVPLIVVLFYWLLFRDLPFYYIKQCLPYFGTYITLNNTEGYHQRTLLLNILVNGYVFIKYVLSSWANIAFALLINIMALQCLTIFLKSHIDHANKQEAFLFFIGVSIFYVLCLHEFLLLGVFYQAFWAEPFKILLIFGIIGFSLYQKCQSQQILAVLFILIIAFFQAPREPISFQQYQNPREIFKYSSTTIEIGNDPDWAKTVIKTAKYLNKNLSPNEYFWAIPYDPLYYFLTKKPSPTKELMLLNLNIPPEQEIEIIKSLEKNKVNYILWSNRGNEEGIPSISEKYCPTIAKYLLKNYEVEVEFGPWHAEPFWWSNHGTQILKRKIISPNNNY